MALVFYKKILGNGAQVIEENICSRIINFSGINTAIHFVRATLSNSQFVSVLKYPEDFFFSNSLIIPIDFHLLHDSTATDVSLLCFKNK